jgi:hypothetical protein
MPTTFDFTLNTFQEDCSVGQISDDTVYGTPNPDRGLRANKLISGFVNSDGDVTIVTTTPVDSNPLANLIYDFVTPKDAHYKFILFSVSDFYSAVTTYSLNDITYYATTGGFYIAIDDAFDSVDPDAVNGASYWTLLDDAALLLQVDNTSTTVEIYTYDDIVDCRGNDALRDYLEEAIDAGLCKDKNCDFELVHEQWRKMDLMVNGAQSMNFQGRQSEAEEIIREYSFYADL